MAIREILLLGHPTLRKRCTAVQRSEIPLSAGIIADLRDTLADFQKRKGFGRGIAAPQLGVSQRIIYIDFQYTGALINPKIISASKSKFELWDDCFSFPDLLIRVRRHQSVTVEFLDESGAKRKLKATGALSELLQHEIDHLDGVLAVDRAIDSRHIILRSEFEKLQKKNKRIF